MQVSVANKNVYLQPSADDGCTGRLNSGIPMAYT